MRKEVAGAKWEKAMKKRRERIKNDPAYRIVHLCKKLDVEMDGVSPIPATAAAILNGIRSALNELPVNY